MKVTEKSPSALLCSALLCSTLPSTVCCRQSDISNRMVLYRHLVDMPGATAARTGNGSGDTEDGRLPHTECIRWHPDLKYNKGEAQRYADIHTFMYMYVHRHTHTDIYISCMSTDTQKHLTQISIHSCTSTDTQKHTQRYPYIHVYVHPETQKHSHRYDRDR